MRWETIWFDPANLATQNGTTDSDFDGSTNSAEYQATSDPTDAGSSSLEPGKGSVLVVDDEAPIRMLTKRLLERQGFRVLTAADGQDGVDMLRANADQVVCVLLDLTMPKMSGDEVLEELRRIRPAVNVIVSSGYDEQDDNNRFAGEGFAGFLLKPYQPLQLIAKACRIMNPK